MRTYIEQPLAFIEKNNETKFCKLEKSIYGLKQASRQWNIKFHDIVQNYGFSRSFEDFCVYIKTMEAIRGWYPFSWKWYYFPCRNQRMIVSPFGDERSWGSFIHFRNQDNKRSSSEKVEFISRLIY